MDSSLPLPQTEAEEELDSKQVAFSSSWLMSPRQGGFWGHLHWEGEVLGTSMRCLEQSVGTGIPCGGT